MDGSHLPPGFRFHPTDEELLVHYLKRKAAGKLVDDWIIGEIDIYKFEPAELPGLAVLHSRDSEWFFFNAQDKRYLHGSRPNRMTKAGYWKATGKDRKVSAGSCVGLKKTLVYYVGRAPRGARTDWIMHEYRLDEEINRKLNCDTSFVLCRIRRKSGAGPRNGEQYGAPVLEEEEDEEVNNLVNAGHALPSPSVNSTGERHVQEVPMMERGEDFDSFIESLLRFEEPEQDQVRKGGLVMDLWKDRSDPAPTLTETMNFLDIDFSSMDNFGRLQQPADSESVILNDILHLVDGQREVPPELPSGMQVPSHDYHMDALQNAGFLELVDLEEPCHEPSTIESTAFEGLLLKMGAGMEFPRNNSIPQEDLQMQHSLQSPDHRESVRGLQHVGDSSKKNEQEVPLDVTLGLSVLETIQNRLSTADDGAAASGLAYGSNQEGPFTSSNGHGYKTQEHAEVDNLVENGNSSASRVEPGTEQLISKRNHSETSMEGADFTAWTPNASSGNHSAQSARRLSSSSSLARVISGLLGKVKVLPASAEELPMGLEGSQLQETEESLCFFTESKARKLALMHPSSSINFRVELTNEKQIPELELQWPLSSSDQQSMRPCRSFSNGFSMFLFWITTLVLIVFCSLRVCCRLIRAAVA